MNRRQFICLVLVFALIASFLPAIVSAESTVTVNLKITAGQRTIFNGAVDVPENTNFKDSIGQTYYFAKPTALAALLYASEKNGFFVKTTKYSFGVFVNKIANVSGTDNNYWAFYFNDEYGQVGADSQVVVNGDSVSFDYTISAWQKHLSAKSVNNAGYAALKALARYQQTNGKIENYSTSAWAAMAFSAARRNPSTIKSKRRRRSRNLVYYLSTYSPSLCTDFSRQILAVVASGKNPYNFKRRNLVRGLLKKYEDGQFGNPELVNDDVFAVLALLASRRKIYERCTVNSLKFITSTQRENGGFSWSKAGTEPDVDSTCAALQALVHAKKKGFSVNIDENINKALQFIKTSQNQDGGFPYTPTGQYSNSNVASTAWAIQALIKAGEDVNNVKALDGSTAYNYLANAQKDNGAFGWQSKADASSPLMTCYAVMALYRKPLPVFYQPSRGR